MGPAAPSTSSLPGEVALLSPRGGGDNRDSREGTARPPGWRDWDGELRFAAWTGLAEMPQTSHCAGDGGMHGWGQCCPLWMQDGSSLSGRCKGIVACFSSCSISYFFPSM